MADLGFEGSREEGMDISEMQSLVDQLSELQKNMGDLLDEMEQFQKDQEASYLEAKSIGVQEDVLDPEEPDNSEAWYSFADAYDFSFLEKDDEMVSSEGRDRLQSQETVSNPSLVEEDKMEEETSLIPILALIIDICCVLGWILFFIPIGLLSIFTRKSRK